MFEVITMDCGCCDEVALVRNHGKEDQEAVTMLRAQMPAAVKVLLEAMGYDVEGDEYLRSICEI